MGEKILIIDDEERILQTFARSLRLEGYTVFTAAEATAGIAIYGQEHPALTFVDLRMPGQDGFAVLHTIRAQEPDAEVILMTGHGDQETVIAALRADASDFIPKPIEAETLHNVLRRAQERLQWKRDLRAAQAALRESHAHLEQQVAARTVELAVANAALQQRNQELNALNAALQESETRFRSIFEQATVGLSHSALDGAFIRVNQRFCDIVGYTQAELTRLTFQDITHPDDLDADLGQMQRILAGDLTTYTLEKRYYRQDGALIWVNLTVSLGHDGNDAPQYFVAAIEDITARHRAQAALRESEERYRLIFQNSPVGIFHYDTALRITHCNAQLVAMLQSSQERLIGLDMHHLHDQVIFPALESSLRGETGYYEGWYHATTGPACVWATFRTAPLYDSAGQIVGGIGIAEDFTARRQMEEALSASEHKYRQLAESITDVIWILDLETARFQYVSPAVEALRGYTVAEVLAQDMAAAVSPDSLRHIQQILPERIAAFQAGRLESYIDLIEQPCKDGSTVWTEVASHYYRNAQTGHLEVYGVSRDITARRQAEFALRQSDERLKEAQRIAHLGRWELDLRSNHLYWSEGIYEIFELDPHTFGASYQAFLDAIHPDDRDAVNQAYTESLETRRPYEIAHRLLMQDGRVKWVHEMCRTEYDAEGQPLRSIGIVQDITEHHLIEDALRESEARYRLLFEEMQSGFALHEILCDAAGRPYDYRFLDVNPAFERLTGLRRADLIGKTALEVLPGTESYWIERYGAVALTGAPCHFENFSRALDRYYTVVAYRPKPGQFAVIFSDVTDHKRAELALQESEEKYRLLFETMVQGVVYHAADGRIISANPAAARILGLSLDQMTGRTSLDPHWRAIHEDGADFPGETHPAMVALRTGRTVRDVVMGIYHPLTEDYVWINIHATPQFRPGDATPAGVYATFEDITARRQAEAENLRLASFPQLTPDPILELNAAGLITFYNDAAIMAARQLNGGDVQDFVPADIADMLTALAQQQETQFYREVTVGAAIFGEYLHTVPTFRCLRIYAHDISDRKETESLIQIRLQLVEYAATHSLDELLQETLDRIGALTHSPIGFYHFVEPDQKTLSLQAWSTRTLREFCTAQGKGLHYPVDQAGVWVECVYQRRAVIHNDYMALPHRKGLPEGHAPVIREMVAPVMRGEQVVAILGVGNRATDYTEKDVEIVSYLADIAWEITARKRAEERLQAYTQQLERMVAEKVAELDRERLKTMHSARMVALGELATGIAHELRQPLTAMQFDADYLRMLAQQWQTSALPAPACTPAELNEVSQNIVGDIARARRLIDHLRVFGRMPETTTVPTNLNQAIEDSLLLTRERLRQHNIEIQTHLSPDLPLILANTHKLEQVFLNFISNAEYALMEQEARSEKPAAGIEPPASSRQHQTASYQKQLEIATYTEGESIIARVRDNGSGIPPEALPRIFEPFFTTKPVGEGTGLGLPICADIVQECDGEITVESVVGVGTTFILRFPVMKPST